MSRDVLINENNNVFIIEHIYTVEEYFTFNIKIKSGEFSGSSNFCIPKFEIIKIGDALSKMYNELKGFCEIKDFDSDAYIRLDMDKFGHMFIFGQIGGSHEDHFMKFKFTSDQTVLDKFINIIEKLN